MLDHPLQKQPIELDAFGGGELRHFFVGEHTGHEAAGLMMRVRPGDLLAAHFEPLAHHVHLVFLRYLDAQAEPLEVLGRGAIGDERHHLHRLRVVADHPLHEFDVGRRVTDFRQIGGLRGADRLRFLSRRAGLKDASASRRTAAGGLTGADADGERQSQY
jgi:hypothetical protein